jgi:hypothetical protein
MNALSKIRAAQLAAQTIIASFQNEVPADAVEVRAEELKSLKKDELIARIIELEKPKADTKVKVEDVARALMENVDCATLTWSDVADLIQSSGFGEKTSAASIASYASKKKAEWAIVPREKLKFNAADLLAAVNG